MRNGLLRACNPILAAIGKALYNPGLHVDFSEKGTEAQVNTLFRTGVTQNIIGGMNYKIVHSVFPILEAFIDRSTGCVEKAFTSKVYVLYSKLMMIIQKDEEIEE